MTQRQIYPFDVYNGTCSATYEADDGNFVLADIQDNIIVIQYPRPWSFDECVQWAQDNKFPVPESFEGTPEGCLMFASWENWIGNIIRRL